MKVISDVKTVWFFKRINQVLFLLSLHGRYPIEMKIGRMSDS